ncbi:hypothetical protein [Ammoniphilus resinae]|uniref:Uncharacterized protein n=1 Tax=Ammoniphilus resinae TaxID=861532 RepID=A0ABS4GX62_9BACL|nr:hypothetical protein [Ammoniphilus resinae]MBP1934865.1 hypothetical protein [Ammoniphilus resinae]
MERLIYKLKRFWTLEDFHGIRAFILIFIATVTYFYHDNVTPHVFSEGLFYSAIVWVGYFLLFFFSKGKLVTRDIKDQIYKFIQESKEGKHDPVVVQELSERYIDILDKFKDAEANEMIQTLSGIQQGARVINKRNSETTAST